MVSAPYNQSRSTLVASAKRIDLSDNTQAKEFAASRKSTQWQSDAWDFYDLIGEIKFVANLISNAISRINLYVGFVDDPSQPPSNFHKKLPDDEILHKILMEKPPITDAFSPQTTPSTETLTSEELEKLVTDYTQTAQGILALLDSGDDGLSEILRLAALNLFIAGEFYFIRRRIKKTNPHSGKESYVVSYEVHSTEEIKNMGSDQKPEMYLKTSPDLTKKEEMERLTPLPSDPVDSPLRNNYYIRMYRKHPRFTNTADSSVRGVLTDCEDLLVMERESRAVSLSNIPPGILFLPDSMDQSASPQSDADEGSDMSDHFDTPLSDQVADGYITPIQDASSSAAVVPLVITGPAAEGEKIRYISTSRQQDPMHATLADRKLDRILASLDIPKDIASGLSAVKYSNGVIIEESFYKSHIEPLILLIVDSLTRGFLKPALEAHNFPPELTKRLVVWYDPSPITAKPSKSEAASFGIENDLISDKAWRSANGFADTDAPDERQFARKITMSKLVPDPALSNSLLKLTLPKLMNQSREQALQASDPSSANALNEALQIGEQPAPVIDDQSAEPEMEVIDETGGAATPANTPVPPV
jgi:hypothetical protein